MSLGRLAADLADKLPLMKSTLGRFNLHWLNAAAEPSANPVDECLIVQRMDYPIAPALGTAWAESLELNEGFRLYRAVHHLETAAFGKLVSMIDVMASEPEPVFCAQTWLSGMACHLEYDKGRSEPPVEVWGRPGLDTFRLKLHWDARVQIAGGGVSEMRSVMIPQSHLHMLLGEDVGAQLMAILGLDGAITAVTRQVPLHLNAPLRDAFSERYVGPARRMFAQAKALEYLGGIVDFFHVNDRKEMQRRHTLKIRALKDNLLSLEGRIPTLAQLAAEFGLSAKQLNIEFKAEYGQSIFEFVTESRLDQAHDALLQTNQPMKVISERLGYSHVNHFITAFRRKFGYPPGSVRSRRPI